MALGMAKPPHFPPEGGQGGLGVEGRDREGNTVNYRVSFPTIISRLRCPVEVCQGSASSRTNLQVHFSHQQSQDSIIILEEWNQPHPRSLQCDIFVPQEALNFAHLISVLCRHGSDRKQRRLFVAYTEERVGRVFLSYGIILTSLPSFNYLGFMLLSSDNDWSAVDQNILRAQGNWGRMVNLFGREGGGSRTVGRFYVAVVQAVLLFGS